MAGLKAPPFHLAIFVALMVLSVQMVASIEQHHVVGDDNGWDTSTDLNSWASGRSFKVGDIIWFTYTAGQESVVELESINEISSCDLSNPIKMYTEGLNKVSLDGEGSRFFASGNLESCKKGLKIHIDVHPKEENNVSHNDGHLSLETKDEDDDSSSPDEDSPPTPKPKPKPKKSPPPPDVGPDDDSPPTPKPKPKQSPPPPKPKPHPPPPSSSNMLDGSLFVIVVAFIVIVFT